MEIFVHTYNMGCYKWGTSSGVTNIKTFSFMNPDVNHRYQMAYPCSTIPGRFWPVDSYNCRRHMYIGYPSFPQASNPATSANAKCDVGTNNQYVTSNIPKILNKKTKWTSTTLHPDACDRNPTTNYVLANGQQAWTSMNKLTRWLYNTNGANGICQQYIIGKRSEEKDQEEEDEDYEEYEEYQEDVNCTSEKRENCDCPDCVYDDECPDDQSPGRCGTNIENTPIEVTETGVEDITM